MPTPHGEDPETLPFTGLIAHLPNGETRGVDPQTVPLEELLTVGHQKRPLSAVIRDKCIDCSGGSRFEADHCTAVKCALWPYRKRTNPFSARRGNSRSFKSEAPRQVLPSPPTVPPAETAFLAGSGERHRTSKGGSPGDIDPDRLNKTDDVAAEGGGM